MPVGIDCPPGAVLTPRIGAGRAGWLAAVRRVVPAFGRAVLPVARGAGFRAGAGRDGFPLRLRWAMVPLRGSGPQDTPQLDSDCPPGRESLASAPRPTPMTRRAP